MLQCVMTVFGLMCLCGGISDFAEIDCFSLCLVCVRSSGMFKYPQHMAWETRGEMEPTYIKFFTGKGQEPSW